ncbi:hypothetical protein HXX76_009259 [Chlamydomonas incerta]|uniref:Uncharacterized protein n=1 Tax=Chlamydomonas incerta TaxID=51695 RepID=A0A835SXG2_CHLIN|nr:hypothetical protein HXX76_009259 [Chlamydomonas incerta]|eukprot:KAG2431763.1 hypothetical protein HXX76_009259 [Chlamydomonas incerta]
MSDRRSKRRCVTVKSQVPSAIHYVGYVEDDETPEMIMKKFEELERIKKAAQERRQQAGTAGTSGAAAGPAAVQPAATSPDPNQPPAALTSTSTANGGEDAGSGSGAAAGAGAGAGPSGAPQGRTDPAPAGAPAAAGASAGACPAPSPALLDAADAGAPPPPPPPSAAPADESQHALDDEALLEVFKQTSVFNVRSALANNDLLMEGEHNAMHGRDQGGYGGYGYGYGGDVAYGMEDLVYGAGGGDSDLEDEELQGFWSDEDYEVGGKGGAGRDAAAAARRRRAASAGGGGGGGQRSGGGAAAPRQPRAPGAGGQSRHMVHQVVTQYNRDTNALIRRRIRVGSAGGAAAAGALAGGCGLVQLRIPPPPLPLSWGRTVRPYVPPEPIPPPEPLEARPAAAAAAPPPAPPEPKEEGAEGADAAAAAATAATAAAAAAAAAEAAAAECRGYEAADLTRFPFDKALAGKTYQCIMVNAGWQPADAADAFERGEEAAVLERLRSVPIPKLCPKGFIMVWAHKGLLQAVCRALAGWGYVYVENLTWVHMSPANAIAGLPGRHFRRSHSTLLMFRREGEGRDIELRHQRNPDVVFDCVRCLPEGGGWDAPAEVLTAVETLLPAAKGAFLELWAQRGVRRPGWDHIAEVC